MYTATVLKIYLATHCAFLLFSMMGTVYQIELVANLKQDLFGCFLHVFPASVLYMPIKSFVSASM